MAKQTPDPFQWVGATVDGKYRVDSAIGEGGFGIVYRAHHLGFEDAVAIKCLQVPDALIGSERERFFSGFMAEGRILHQLSRATAGIVQALDVGATVSPSGKWTPYIVLEWLEGSALDVELSERNRGGFGGRELREAVELLSPAARALAMAHEQNVAHRDVKPANLFLAEVAGRMTMKVLDFGIAKVMSQTASVTRAFEATGGSVQAFTPRYGAPEQFSRRYGATGPWTDVFAFALVLVEVVAGRPALEGEDTAQLFIAASDTNRRPTLLAHGVPVPDEVDAVIKKALAVDPKDRYRTLGEFWDALCEALDDKDAVSAQGRAVPPARPPQQSLLGRALAATRVAAGGADASSATQLSSSQPLPVADGIRGAPLASRARAIGGFAAASLAAGSAFAMIAALGYVVWRPAEPAAVLRTVPSAPASAAPAPAPDASEPRATRLLPSPVPEPKKPAPTVPRDSARGRLTAREIPAGRTPNDQLWTDRFRLDQFETTQVAFAEAQKSCHSHGMGLCTETQFQRACQADPLVGSGVTWTATADPAGIVLRGGTGCDARRVLPSAGAERHAALCCDVAVAIKTEATSPSLMSLAAAKMQKFEQLYNRHDAAAFEVFFDDGVIVDRKPKTRRGAVELIRASFSEFPDQWTAVDWCAVTVNATKRVRRSRKVLAQTWSTSCDELRYRAGQLALVRASYVFTGAGKLKALTDDEVRREWSAP